MATKDLYKRQGDFLTPATDTVPTLGPYDVNTPAGAREGLPLRPFDPKRARYAKGDVASSEEKQYNQALNIFHLMAREGKTEQEIKTRIGENMFNKIVMNKQKMATGGIVPTDPLLDPRFGRYFEQPEYRAYAGGGLADLGFKNKDEAARYIVKAHSPWGEWDSASDSYYNMLRKEPYVKLEKYIKEIRVKKAEGGPVLEEEGMVVPELQPQSADVNMQVDTMMTPSEVEGETEPDEMEVEANIDTSVLTSDEEQVLEAAIEDYPELVDIISKMSMKEFTGEGEIEGPGTGTSDSIPAMLSDGEFVFTAKAVKQLGVDKLRNMMGKAEMDYDKDMGVQDMNNEPMSAARGGLMTSRYR